MSQSSTWIDQPMVARLIAKRFPRWAELPIVKLRSSGTDNALFRLGEDMVVRAPRHESAVNNLRKEHLWLPRLAPALPVDVPVPLPLAKAEPDNEFPYPWSVYRWIDGDNAYDRPIVELNDAATRLGRFVAALRQCDSTGGPLSNRTPVSVSDDDVRSRIRDLSREGVIDAATATTATAVWEEALAAPTGTPVWTHGDLHPANLISRDGRLEAVIDFGTMGVGDLAFDMLPAWTCLTAETRERFRVETGVDNATWTRGRGWALSSGLGMVWVYRVTNPVFGAMGQYAIVEACADYQRTN